MPAPLPLALKRFLRDPLLTLERRRTAYRRLERLAIENPQTFSEKLIHKMAYDRRPLLRTFADKFAVREFVSERVGSDVLPNLYGIYDRADRIDWERLPREFVLKATHGSGAVAVVWEGASRGSRPTVDDLPTWAWRDQIHPDDLDRTQLARLADGWMDMNYELLTPRPEWAYSDLPRRVLAEEVLTDSEGLLPSDYKLYMMHGSCTLIDVHIGRFGEYSGELRSPEWELLPGNFVRRQAPVQDTPPPANLAHMIQIGEALSRDVDFVRVDLYDLGDRVVFGELTNYPAAATGQYSPGLDMLLGQGWNPPRRYV